MQYVFIPTFHFFQMLSFCLYIPESNPENIISVEVTLNDSRRRKLFSCPLKPRVITQKLCDKIILWEGEMEFEKGKYISYIYGVKWKNRYVKPKVVKYKINDDLITQRDTWNDTLNSSQAAITAHIIHIMDGADDDNLKHRINDLKQFCNKNTSLILIDAIKSFQLYKQNDSAFQVLFFFFLTLVSADVRTFSRSRVLCLLEQCNNSNHTIDALPLLQTDCITRTVVGLAKAAGLAWMDLITYTYNFLDTRVNKTVLEAFRLGGHDLSARHTEQHEAKWKERRQITLVALCRRACLSTGRSEIYVHFFTALLTNMDDKEVFESYAVVLNNVKNEEGFAKFNIHFRVFFISKLENHLQRASENCDIKDLAMYWEFIVDAQLFEVEGDFKRTINNIFSQHTNSTHGARENCKSILKLLELGAFETVDEEKKLLECIVNDFSYYQLFPVIIKNHTAKLKVPEECLNGIALMYLETSFKKNDSDSIVYIQTLCEDFGAIYEVEYIHKQGVDIRKKFYSHMKCFDIDTVLRSLETIKEWKGCGATSFFNYILELIGVDSEPFVRRAKYFCHVDSNIMHR